MGLKGSYLDLRGSSRSEMTLFMFKRTLSRFERATLGSKWLFLGPNGPFLSARGPL